MDWISPELSFDTPDDDRPEVGDNIKVEIGPESHYLIVTDVGEDVVTFVVLPWKWYTTRESVA